VGKSENPTRLAVVQIGSVKRVGYLVPLHLEGEKRLIGYVVRNGDNPIGSHGRYTVAFTPLGGKISLQRANSHRFSPIELGDVYLRPQNGATTFVNVFDESVDEQTPEVTAWLFASRELAEWKLGTLQAATNWGEPVQRPLIHL